MKRQIRQGVYETASSSVHAISYDPSGMRKNHLKMKKGYVITDFGQFGTDFHIYGTQDAKLSYLITQLYYINHYSEDIEDMYEFRDIEEAIKEYDPRVLGIKVLKETIPEIDHQSQPSYNDEVRFVNYWDQTSIQEFLFNKYIRIKTDCD